jgi:hypothetical protein
MVIIKIRSFCNSAHFTGTGVHLLHTQICSFKTNCTADIALQKVENCFLFYEYFALGLYWTRWKYVRRKLQNIVRFILYICHVLFHNIIVVENFVKHRSGLAVRDYNSLASNISHLSIPNFIEISWVSFGYETYGRTDATSQLCIPVEALYMYVTDVWREVLEDAPTQQSRQHLDRYACWKLDFP